MLEYWVPLARQLGLGTIVEFSNYIVLSAENLEVILKELKIFCQELLRKEGGNTHASTRVAQLIDVLEPLKHSAGWEASIG